MGDIPYALHVDEAGMACDAISLASFGVDRYQNPYPVYFINFGGGQNAMYTYLSAVLLKFFGYSKVIIRLPAVVFRLFTFIAIYLIVMKLEYLENDKREKALLFLFLFSICHYLIMNTGNDIFKTFNYKSKVFGKICLYYQ